MAYANHRGDQLAKETINESNVKHNGEPLFIEDCILRWNKKPASLKTQTNNIFREEYRNDDGRDCKHFANLEESKLLFLQEYTYKKSEATPFRQVDLPFGRLQIFVVSAELKFPQE